MPHGLRHRKAGELVKDARHANRIIRSRIENSMFARFYGIYSGEGGIERRTLAWLLQQPGKRAIEPLTIGVRKFNAPLFDAM